MQSELLSSRIRDTVSICLKTSKPKFLGFLSLEEKQYAKNILKELNCKYEFFGGYEDSERVILGCFPDWADCIDFPVSSFTFEYRKCDALRHKDFLGSFMALGIKREAVGDILVSPGKTITFLLNDVAGYVKTQITKIGNTGVIIKDGYTNPLPVKEKMLECSAVISSCRLDCVIAGICSVSRSKATEIIESKLCCVNSIPNDKITSVITNGDVISVRGKGKFYIVSSDSLTKKQKIILNYKKYN